MATSTFSRRIVMMMALGVALPAMALAGLGIFLTLRIVQAVEAESRRYHRYMAQQVAEGFEQELMAHLRDASAPAENVVRTGGDRARVLAALESRGLEFGQAHVVDLAQLPDYFMLLVESQPLVYGAAQRGSRGERFVGVMLRDAEGDIVGAGGWWLESRVFLRDHLTDVVEDRLASNERIYGGLEALRHVAVVLVAPDQQEIGRVRNPGSSRTSSSARLEGPFAGFSVSTLPTPDAPVAWTRQFLMFEVGFIGLMGLVIAIALVFGLRFTVRQIELARIKSSFVSNVSHELKTPISLIRIAVETLEMQRVTSPEETKKFLRRIRREAIRLNQLVDNILDFARLEAGQRPFRFGAVDVAELVRETVDSFRIRIEDQGFAFAMELPPGLPAVRGDANAIAQCLLNLLDNAVKYSRTRREIRIVVATRPDGVAISVSDRGIGIDPRDQKRIFEKFVRLDSGLVHDVRGAGLGLSLVSQIVKAHGGRIEVNSVPGEGSTFTLVFPPDPGVAEPQGELQERTAS